MERVDLNDDQDKDVADSARILGTSREQAVADAIDALASPPPADPGAPAGDDDETGEHEGLEPELE